jgi:hypothetical protein
MFRQASQQLLPGTDTHKPVQAFLRKELINFTGVQQLNETTQTLIIQIKNNSALKALNSLAERNFIKIVDDAHTDSPALPGGRLSLKVYRNRIANAEHTPIMDLKEAKAKWAVKKKQLQNLSR